MKETYLKYYENYSPIAQLLLLKDAVFSKSQLKKMAALNRHKDYGRIGEDRDLLLLHRDLNLILLRGKAGWNHYDYGENYFYQGLNEIRVTGFRPTEERFQQMRLDGILAGKRVLDIGCNAGFLSLMVARHASHVTGFDINPYLIEIAQRTARYLGIANCEFSSTSFEEFVPQQSFDAVISCANHSTYDQNTKQDISKYFEKCRASLKPGGILVFESHPPELEGSVALEATLTTMRRYFDFSETQRMEGGFMNRGRTFAIGRARALNV